jgi:hypothetical protein
MEQALNAHQKLHCYVPILLFDKMIRNRVIKY